MLNIPGWQYGYHDVKMATLLKLNGKTLAVFGVVVLVLFVVVAIFPGT